MQYACVLKLKIMSAVGVNTILGITVVLLDVACEKKESVHTVHYLLPALLHFLWHSI
jgi:RsiW-degrading membrane proteinase PrsW (M82 family)